ncbi:hypothetical protein JCM19379_28480 [Methyloparacoccus murrellii]
MALNEPNEEPKWAALVLLGGALAWAGGRHVRLACREGKPLALTLPGTLLTLFFLGLAAGAFYAINPGGAINRLSFWCASGLVFVSVAWATQHVTKFTAQLRRALLLSCGLLSLLFWRGYFFDFPRQEFDKFVLFSPIGHFNYTADTLVLLIPLVTWALLSLYPRGPSSMAHAGLWLILGLFSLATLGFMLIASGSLGGFGGVALGGFVALLIGWGTRLRARATPNWRFSRHRMMIGLVALVIMASTGQFAYQHMPQEYREGLFTRAIWWQAPKPQDFAKAQNLPPLAPLWIKLLPYVSARTPMWAATAGMVAEHPWRGFGTGSFLYEYQDFSKRYDLLQDFETLGIKVKNHPHNILLQIASENGIPMTLLFCGLYVWLTWVTMRRAWHEPNAFWLCAVWALWAAWFDAQFNHVFFNPASLFMSSLAFGLIYGRLRVDSTLGWLPICSIWRYRLTSLITGLIALILTIYPLRWVASEYYVAEAIRLSRIQPRASQSQIGHAWQMAYAWLPLNSQASFGLAKYYFDQQDYGDATYFLNDFLEFAPHHSEALNLLAHIQLESGELEQAKLTLEHALKLEPDAPAIKKNLERVNKMMAKEKPIDNQHPD